MWNTISKSILKFRTLWIVLIVIATLLMSWQASKIELAYNFTRILPATDPTEMEYIEFRKLFGEDAGAMMIGWEDPDIFKLEKFRDWQTLSEELKNVAGVKNVLSVTNLVRPVKDDSLSRFQFVPVVGKPPGSQEELDRIREEISGLPFYEGLIFNKQLNVTLMVVTFNDKDINTKARMDIVRDVRGLAEAFGARNNTELHFSGMPFIRTAMMKMVSSEMVLFLVMAVLVTALILWFFFRSLRLTFVSIGIVLVGVIFSLGTLQLFGYKISILTGLLPPLLIVIGVPNCVFLINKYQSELREHGNKEQALHQMVAQIGLSTLLANLTTAIGFGVFYFTNTALLVEFGVVSAINVMITYVLCLVLLTITLYYMDVPKRRHLKHLDGAWAEGILRRVNHWVLHKRRIIYGVMVVLILVAAYGITKIKVVGFVVDDLPKDNVVYRDLRFFESRFSGVLPFEIVIDTREPNGVFGNQARTLYKIKALQTEMEQYSEFSKPVSVTEATRFLYQGFRGGDAKYYVLPGAMELAKLAPYLAPQADTSSNQMLKNFLNEDRSITRVSYQMADVGSVRIKELLASIRPKIDSIFPPETYKVSTTGHSLVFLKSNDYLLDNLFESLIIAILLIALVGMILFRSVWVILMSKLPCLIPLALTAGIMGYFDIHFKPTTILIFSITFGIASDGTVYFLTRYRHELRNRGLSVQQAITNALYGTGLSMIYTAIILFCGFSIFAASSFGGTADMGIMVSITLLVAMCTNLILLPALMYSIHSRVEDKEKEPAVL